MIEKETLEIEALEIRDFLSTCPPLRSLDTKTLNHLTESIEILYLKRDNILFNSGDSNSHFHLLRSGAISLTNDDDKLHGSYSEGEWFGHRSAMGSGFTQTQSTAIEDTLIYRVPLDVMKKVMEKYPKVSSFFSDKKITRIRRAISQIRENEQTNFHALHVADLMRRAILVEPNQSVQEVAGIMDQINTSLVLVMEGHKLIGILTDTDLRSRIVAAGADIHLPISDFMTPDPITISSRAQVTQALLLMMENNIDALPAMDAGQVSGVITTRDLVKAQGENAVFLVAEIHRARDVTRLRKLSKRWLELLVTLVKQRLSSKDIGQAMSSVSQAINQRLLVLAEKEFGPPPVPYAWAVAGSMARYEQTAHSDQDNMLILDNQYIASLHGEYFENLTKFVSDGLDACGFVYCPGNVMATNPKWCITVNEWIDNFKHWIESPEPEALMYACIFFDMRVIFGEKALYQPIRDYINNAAPKNRIFLSFMAGNGLQHTPPLGFFRNFVLEKNGDKQNVFNLKHRGVVPIIDLARNHALSGGVPYLNTFERLNACEEKKVISEDGTRDLINALELIGTIRLKHQAKQIERGDTPDNFVSPEELSPLERRHLKDAFAVVDNMQDAMANTFQTTRM